MCLERLIVATSGQGFFSLLSCLCSIPRASLKTCLIAAIQLEVIIPFPERLDICGGINRLWGGFYLFVWFSLCVLCSALWRTLWPCLLTQALACVCPESISGFTSPVTAASFSSLQCRRGVWETETAHCRRNAEGGRRLFWGHVNMEVEVALTDDCF